MTFRWYGARDPVTLEQIRQIPVVEGIVAALYDVPAGLLWDEDRLDALKREIEAASLRFAIDGADGRNARAGPFFISPADGKAAGYIGDAQSVEDFLGRHRRLHCRHRHVFWVNVVRSREREFTHALLTIQAHKAFHPACEGLGKNADMRKT